jgi:hypothetical protein
MYIRFTEWQSCQEPFFQQIEKTVPDTFFPTEKTVPDTFFPTSYEPSGWHERDFSLTSSPVQDRPL